MTTTAEHVRALESIKAMCAHFLSDEGRAALTAAIAALKATEWHPIESAPNWFLGYEKGDFGPVIYGVVRGPLGDFKLLADPEFEVYPTHWMPLPAGPVEGAKGRDFESDNGSEFR